MVNFELKKSFSDIEPTNAVKSMHYNFYNSQKKQDPPPEKTPAICTTSLET